MECNVLCIQNHQQVNNKVYIGCTERELVIRFQKHVSKANEGSNCSLHKAIRKYGKENFEISLVMEYPTRTEMLEGEIKYIADLGTYESPNGYNDTAGGEGGDTNSGKKFSEEWKSKISQAKLGKQFSEEHKKNLSESHLGSVAPNRKLTFDQAEEIRKEYATGLITQKQLGKKYSLSQDCIFKIVNGRTYNTRGQHGET